MATKINFALTAKSLLPKINRLFELSAAKIKNLEKTWSCAKGTPVYTVKGKYTSRGWTEWTQGFQFGSALLQFDATGDVEFLEIGRRSTVRAMATHVSHMGVHDHGFNNVSTYGNLWRLMLDGKIPFNLWEKDFYELALKISGAVQASRWTAVGEGQGYIYSFNGPHSLFVDTVRSLRVLALAHQFGHVLMSEKDRKISLFERLIQHGNATASYNVYFGESRDEYDVRGRTAHESIFNVNDGAYRCPSSQQGYSAFTTWTRGLAWALLGFSEQLEWFESLFSGSQIERKLSARAQPLFLKAAMATADFYLENTCADGIPMWDTGAPNLHRLGEYLAKPSDPYNQWEPVDSSAAAIAAQGFVRLGKYLEGRRRKKLAARYRQAALTIADTLFGEPYLSERSNHQGMILHSIYHRPNRWDYVGAQNSVPNGESSMWGDYHARELGLLLLRETRGEKYLAFFA